MPVLKVHDGTAWRKVGCGVSPNGRLKLWTGTGWVVEKCDETWIDDFNRADGPVGNGWSVLLGDPEISSNQLVNGSPGTELVMVRDPGTAAFDISAVFDVTEPSSGILFRVQDANNFLAVIIGTSSMSWYKKQAGVFTAYSGFLLGSVAGAEYRIVGTAAGNYKCWVNGSLRVPDLTTTDFLSETKVGLHAGDEPIIDDFTIHDMQVGQPLKVYDGTDWVTVACMVPWSPAGLYDDALYDSDVYG